jgi:hypothetical protein
MKKERCWELKVTPAGIKSKVKNTKVRGQTLVLLIQTGSKRTQID